MMYARRVIGTRVMTRMEHGRFFGEMKNIYRVLVKILNE
jgi:hypothetical protein